MLRRRAMQSLPVVKRYAPRQMTGDQRLQAEGSHVPRVGAQSVNQRANRTSATATARMKRALQHPPSRQSFKPGYFQNTYFLGGPIRTQGPGSSNKWFRSWLASRSRSNLIRYVAFRVRRVACFLTYSLNTLSIRPCHPSPVLRKYAMTSGLYRTDTSSFLFSDFGRPRTDLSGTMAASCLLVSGCASRSALAAARIFAFSFSEGTRMTRLGVAFGIVFDLFALGISETDDSVGFRLGPQTRRSRERCLPGRARSF